MLWSKTRSILQKHSCTGGATSLLLCVSNACDFMRQFCSSLCLFCSLLSLIKEHKNFLVVNLQQLQSECMLCICVRAFELQIYSVVFSHGVTLCDQHLITVMLEPH